MYFRGSVLSPRDMNDESSNAGATVSCNPNITMITPVLQNVTLTNDNSRKRLLTYPDNNGVDEVLYNVDVTRNQTYNWHVTGDVDDNVDEGMFTEMDGDTLYLVSWPHGVKFDIFAGTSCASSKPCSMVRFDQEAQRFVVFAINTVGTHICVAAATSSNVLGSYRVFEFEDGGIHMLDMMHFYVSTWGDYYTACWHSGTDSVCGMMERARIIDYPTYMMAPRITMAVMAFDNGHMYYPMHQDKMERGPLINMHAPCGVFSVLNPAMSRIQLYACTGVSMMNGTFNTTQYHLSVGSFTPYGACIATITGSECKPSFSVVHRTAYYYSSTLASERVAYTFIKQFNGASVVAYGMTTSSVTMNPMAQHYTYAPYASGGNAVNMWAPNLAFNCRADLFLLYNRILNGYVITLDFTYRLRDDPQGTLRQPSTYEAPLYLPNELSYWGYTHAVSGSMSPRRFFGVGSTSDHYAAVLSMRIANVTMQYEYGAQDICGNVATCIWTVYLTNSESCT